MLIPERLGDPNFLRLTDIAEVLGVPVCLELWADSNHIEFTLSLAMCVAVRVDVDARMTILIGDREWQFHPEHVFDDRDLLVTAESVEASLEVANHREESNAFLEMSVWVTGQCSVS